MGNLIADVVFFNSITGFAPELAVVTQGGGKTLEEPNGYITSAQLDVVRSIYDANCANRLAVSLFLVIFALFLVIFGYFW